MLHHVLTPDTEVLKSGIEIFGDCVVDGYHYTYGVGYEPHTLTYANVSPIKEDEDGKHWCLDYGGVALKFNTGNIVCFDTSEWLRILRIENAKHLTVVGS